MEDTLGEEYNAWGGWREIKIQKLYQRNSVNVEYEMLYCTGSQLGQKNSIKITKQVLGSKTVKVFNRLSTKYSCSRIIIHNEESTMILKPK